jgi:hypothetical protein
MTASALACGVVVRLFFGFSWEAAGFLFLFLFFFLFYARVS